MRNFEIWMEGYAATGERAEASRIGNYTAETFDEAVLLYMKDNPNTVEFDRFGKGKHSIWACRLYDNEIDARKSFG